MSSVTIQPTCHAHVHIACLFSQNFRGEDSLFRLRFQGSGTEWCKVGRPGHRCPATKGTAKCSARTAKPHKTRQCFRSTAAQGAGNAFSRKRHPPARKQQPGSDISSLRPSHELQKPDFILRKYTSLEPPSDKSP